MNTKKMTAFIVGAMLIATVLVMAVSAAGMDRGDYLNMSRMVYEFDAATDTGIYINDMGQNEPTLRIYGEEDAIYPTQSYTEADDFVYPDPVDAFDPGVIGADSVTFNPAYMDDAATIDGGQTWDDMKVFLRVFYEPEYGHVKDGLMESTIADWQRKNLLMPEGALVTETTYMLVADNDLMGICNEPYNTGHSGDPITGAADVTQFTMPVNSGDSNDGNPGMDVDEIVDLLSAVHGDTVTDGEIEVGMTHYHIATSVAKRFMDHEVVFTGSDSNYAFFEITYLGNMYEEEPATTTLSVPLFDQKTYVTRYHYTQTTTDPAHRWFISVSDVNCAEWCDFTIGRYLAAGETFYVDGIRYDMPAIYVTDADEFKYITLQSPLPKCTGCECAMWVPGGYADNQVDYSHVSNQWLARLLPGVSVWMLPPFDSEHQMIDDIDLDKKYDSANECWYLDTEAGNIIQNWKPALEFRYADEDIEERFNSSLAERHSIRKDGVQIWNWWNIYTKPYNYTTLVLPDQETTNDRYKLWDGDECNPGYDIPNADGNEYLVTTSFIAPNSEADEREELCKSSRENHSIIDRAADIAVVDDDRRDAYLGMPRMVFEYDAVDTEDLFVNDDGMGNATVRIYGEAGAIYPTQSMTGAVDFIYPDAVDPFDPGVVVKDSVTFNPAYINNGYGSPYKEITVDGADGDEKVFLRAFYEPGYYHPIDAKMNNAGSGTDPVYMANGALVVETTYMLLHDNSGSGHSGAPKAGAARDGDGSVITYFMLPTHSNNLFDDVAGMNRAQVVDLNWASGAGTTQLTDGEIEVQTRPFTLKEGQARNFMDHKIEFVRPTTGMEIKLDISYIGNMKKVEDRLRKDVEVNEDQKYYVDRLNNLHTSPDPDWRFYFEVVSMTYDATLDKYEANLIVGRYLAAGETFYVDGVRYDMPAIYVTDEDKFKYITFQTPLPKCDGEMWYDANEANQADKSHVTCQWLANILEREIVYDGEVIVDILNNVWVLPPFNAGHTMIDDIDLDKSWNCGGIQENISVEVAGNILGEVDPLEFYYIAEEAELRFDSSLAERHAYDGSAEIWNWWSIFTKPCQYTEIVLPDQETTGMADGNEYLITTSFIAPNCEGAVRDMDNAPFCKPYDTHDIIDRASTLPGQDPTLMEGDVTGDDRVTITDAMFIAQNVTGARLLDADQMKCADTTDDGSVTITDAMHIAQYVVDPDGSLSILFKPLWESPADDDMVLPTP